MLEITNCKKDKVLNINVLWLNDEDFFIQTKNAELILINNKFQPIICAEEQILNLCQNEILISEDENARCQFIVSKIFQAQKFDAEKLLLLARKGGLANPLAQMLGKLKDDFEIKIPAGLL